MQLLKRKMVRNRNTRSILLSAASVSVLAISATLITACGRDSKVAPSSAPVPVDVVRVHSRVSPKST
jgi:hypothetical protein